VRLGLEGFDLKLNLPLDWPLMYLKSAIKFTLGYFSWELVVREGVWDILLCHWAENWGLSKWQDVELANGSAVLSVSILS